MTDIYSNILWYADLVVVEIVDLLVAFTFFVGPVVYLYQGFVVVGIGIKLGIPAVRLDFLQQMATIPNKSDGIFEAV